VTARPLKAVCAALQLAALAGCATTPHAAANAAAATDPMHAAAVPCRTPALSFSYEAPVLDMVRIYTGADGLSHAEPMPLAGQTSTYLGAVLHQFALGDPSNVVIVSGPPDFHIPQHPAPYREFFLILAGSSVIELSDGTEQPLTPGSMVFFEDVTGPGHAGRFGACGYVAVDMQFKPSPAR
jgi:hypothetical protein